MSHSNHEPELSPNEVGTMLGVTGEAVKHWIYSGKLVGSKVHGCWTIKTSALKQFLKLRSAGPKPVLMAIGLDDIATNNFEIASTRLGFESYVAHCASDAALKLKATCPSAVFINVDRETSWTFFQKVRRLRAGRHVPVMLVGGAPLEAENTRTAMRLGACGFVRLPVTIESLSREIRQLIQR